MPKPDHVSGCFVLAFLICAFVTLFVFLVLVGAFLGFKLAQLVCWAFGTLAHLLWTLL